MRLFNLAALFAALILATACTSPFGQTAAGPGPGAECDACAVAEVAPTAAPGGASAAAAATGGQRASNQPVQSDPGARGIYTPISRGAGDQTTDVTSSDKRSQAGAPSVNQGLVIPNAANANAVAPTNPLVASLEKEAQQYRTALALELSKGDMANEKRLEWLGGQLADTNARMNAALASSVSKTENVYNLQGARIVQSVANGSSSGERAPIDADTARAVGEPLAEGVKATMEGGANAAEVLEASKPTPLPPVAPNPLPLPPTGALPPVGEVK